MRKTKREGQFPCTCENWPRVRRRGGEKKAGKIGEKKIRPFLKGSHYAAIRMRKGGLRSLVPDVTKGCR